LLTNVLNLDLTFLKQLQSILTRFSIVSSSLLLRSCIPAWVHSFWFA